MVPPAAPEFRFHDLRSHYASLLIASGSNVKVVEARLRHARAKTTLDSYGFLAEGSPMTTEHPNAALMHRVDEALIAGDFPAFLSLPLKTS